MVGKPGTATNRHPSIHISIHPFARPQRAIICGGNHVAFLEPRSLSSSLILALLHIHTYPSPAILRPYWRPRALFRSQANLGYDGYNGSPLGGESVGPRAGSAASSGGAPPNSLVRFTKLDIDNDDYYWVVTLLHVLHPSALPTQHPPRIPHTPTPPPKPLLLVATFNTCHTVRAWPFKRVCSLALLPSRIPPLHSFRYDALVYHPPHSSLLTPPTPPHSLRSRRSRTQWAWRSARTRAR